jgi:hypothetical protein
VCDYQHLAIGIVPPIIGPGGLPTQFGDDRWAIATAAGTKGKDERYREANIDSAAMIGVPAWHATMRCGPGGAGPRFFWAHRATETGRQRAAGFFSANWGVTRRKAYQ